MFLQFSHSSIYRKETPMLNQCLSSKEINVFYLLIGEYAVTQEEYCLNTWNGTRA